MQPLKITIQGDFWDCQIYRGRLYLWYTDGSIGVYKWDALVETGLANRIDNLVIKCAFTRGDYLYENTLNMLFKDLDVKEVLLRKFLKASDEHLSISSKGLQEFELSRQNNPIQELPTDTCIYNNTLFIIADSGIYSASVHKGTKFGVSSRPKQLWDCPLISVKAGYNALAMAGGDEGVFELYLKNYEGNFSDLKRVEDRIYNISDQHSSLVNWSFASLYSSSYVDSGFLAAFDWDKSQTGRYKRKFNRIIPDSVIFNKAGFSWGSAEKIYLANSNTIEVVKYVQSSVGSENKNPFQHLESVNFNESYGSIISGGIAYFGVIVESEHGISILRSDDTLITFPESVARWRVYPRSKRYENQLHIIYEDRLDIYSFNHDYFSDQDNKVRGIRYRNHRNKYRNESQYANN